MPVTVGRFPTDGPMTIADCGCRAWLAGEEGDGQYVEFAYCQMHQAAPEMLAALRNVRHHADDECGFMVLVRTAIEKAEAPQGTCQP